MKKLNTILLVDDDDTTNYLNQRLLSRMEVAPDIRVVTDGEEALEYLNKAFAGYQDYPRPDLIFVDIKMDGMDGFEFLGEYQQFTPEEKGRTVMLMLTSSASFYDLEKLKEYPDVRKHYSKPLAEADVREIMQEYF
ncbi:response regulator receiver domain-containing protein [Pontibacter ummariensis]|uniref:Response regulator receiver domain-containing protein n=1 Tax=Pontibacter ummariensis TaxID=1610492 RepID=A0A239ILM5_9BACT|nr:response regulator [Pontibacter ummariensis]PRY09862.1 response regulator receiver domain-containing protein [Pontibacter ummariensis]SNS93304.1 Response regulator receiver domain-containing protein [Pontibacter ummariensis]